MHGLLRVANFPFSFRADSPALRPKSPGEVGVSIHKSIRKSGRYSSLVSSIEILNRAEGSCLKEKGKLATREKPCRDLSGSAGGPTLDCATSEPYSKDNCDRLIAHTCKSISWRLSSVVSQASFVAW